MRSGKAWWQAAKGRCRSGRLDCEAQVQLRAALLIVHGLQQVPMRLSRMWGFCWLDPCRCGQMQALPLSNHSSRRCPPGLLRWGSWPCEWLSTA